MASGARLPAPLLVESGAFPPSGPVLLAGPDWVESVDSADSAELVGCGRPPLRSFFAQPEPLKWIVGGLNALVRAPSTPQAGQALGGLPLIEWMTSVVLPQFEQM